MPTFTNYRQLLRAAITEVKQNHYSIWMTDQVRTIESDLKEYEEEKTYTSNVVDVITVALAKVASVKLTIYYVDKENLCSHVIQPIDNFDLNVELSFVNGHYDFICDSTNVRPFLSVPVTSGVDIKPNILIKDSSTSNQNPDGTDVNNDVIDDLYSSSEDDISPIEIVGNRRYIRSTVFENAKKESRERVPDDIDDTCIYVVPIRKGTLNHCKGKRNWGHAQSSKVKSFTAGPRLLFNCRGSYCCSNPLCKNIIDFGVNRSDFERSNNQTLCSICGTEAAFIPCESRLILEQDLNNNKVTCKHFGTHSCPVRVDGRKEGVEKLAKEFPRVTREGLIRQQVQNSLENGGFDKAVGTARQFSDTTYIDNVRRKVKNTRRPDGHSFNAVQILKNSFEKEDKFLIYDFNDGSDGSLPFVLKSSKRKVEVLNNLNMDGNHRLSTETVHLDVLHSR